jgi:ergothioneine biosynthesis protein EgtB
VAGPAARHHRIVDRQSWADRFISVWRRTDMLFALVPADAVLARPISLRNPLIFYIGHLPAFAFNHLCRAVVGRPSFNPTFDEMFERGIDPDVDDPSRCHAHPEAPETWPALADVLAYRDGAREEVFTALKDLDVESSTDVMTRSARVVSMAIEHELMHQETLLYLLQQLPTRALNRPPMAAVPPFASPDRRPRPGTIEVEAGTVTLGASFEGGDFGWDNEFPVSRVSVPEFRIDSLPVTNGQFLHFVQDSGYQRRDLWADEDWTWKATSGLAHPLSWTAVDGTWSCRTLFDDVPFEEAREWPASVSLAEARAYARWAGGRLPTEAEFHRAAYGQPGDGERPFPWGDEPPSTEHGNFDFGSMAPVPVGSCPRGVSAWGVHELVGNGWEWTETVFAPFPGFRAYIPTYPGYSADFFDGKHYVLKGGSWATDKVLLRRSFRNWYQARYPYVFTKFRCVRPGA